ncbi:hypothetical protein J6590_001988 [Homalodisca vitripennis]|nr:hypothetical protein J6590_001988 [Homalodisca vitripennis]
MILILPVLIHYKPYMDQNKEESVQYKVDELIKLVLRSQTRFEAALLGPKTDAFDNASALT